MRLITLSLLTLGMACQSSPADSHQVSLATQAENASQKTNTMANQSLYEQKISLKTIDGESFDFGSLKGKRLLLVNTASFCGYTPQYKQLQELHEQFGGESFVIVGFPANNFGQQEPHDNTTIQEFCSKNFGVSFLMMEKISVSGSDMHPLYQWLTQKSMNGVQDAPVKWNFQKFLIDEEGRWIDVLSSGVSPLDDKVLAFAQGA